MNAIFDDAHDRDCVDLVLRVIALYSERDACSNGWLKPEEIRWR